ncbi:VOC family protein [Niveispirillum fermenti]|uniref:VOC family protein n=1 Tax=Niveispirillum fermenti TaxID=1233113 RepID=UPI003A8453DD
MPLPPRQLTAAIGPVMQLSYIVQDLEEAVRFWAGSMGAGPFFLMEHVAVPWMSYRGQEVQVDFSVALGYWHDMQIELVVQHNEAPSVYRDGQRDGAGGLHHVCLLTSDMGDARRKLAAAGADIIQEGRLDDGAFLYADTHGGPGTMVEVLQAPPALLDLFTSMRNAARDWDGGDPLRKVG